MTELKFGRYFVLQVKVEKLFSWMEYNTKFEWSVEAKGICPHNDKLILSVVFASEEDFSFFEKDFLTDEDDKSSIHLDRRHYKYSWQSSDERRAGIDRRQVSILSDEELEFRRSFDKAKDDIAAISNVAKSTKVCV